MAARSPRTWFRFSLRTLFVLVTLVAVWFGYQMSIVRERQSLRASIAATGSVWDIDPSAARMPDIEDVAWYRRLLGDQAVATLYLQGVVTPADIEQALRVFPEAEVGVTRGMDVTYYRQRDLSGKLQQHAVPLAEPH